MTRRFWFQLAVVIAAWGIAIAVVHGKPRDGLQFACDVDRVVDGDTIRCADMVAPLRLWGVDAPDWNCRGRRHCTADQPRAHAAREFVIGLVRGKRLICEGRDVDRYGRLVASCTLAGADVACLIVRAGHAVDMPRYSGGAYRGCRP
jgi:endonuclease YncB( thermonuclease family)